MKTLAERVADIKRLARAGGRGLELSRREIMFLKQDLERMLQDIDVAYNTDDYENRIRKHAEAL